MEELINTPELDGKILGINERYYPTYPAFEKGYPAEEAYTKVITVLVGGAINDYAAYSGCGDPEWVARFGNKIPFEEACVHFPGEQLKRERYRD